MADPDHATEGQDDSPEMSAPDGLTTEEAVVALSELTGFHCSDVGVAALTMARAGFPHGVA